MHSHISIFPIFAAQNNKKKMEITTSHRAIGFQGEEQAVRYLIEHNYHILARNWQYGHLEVDIIAENEEFIVFCEVKTRKNNRYGEPESFVGTTKQRHLFAAADHYVRHNGIRKEARFDILSVTSGPDGVEIKHLPDAFAPHW